MFSNNSRRARRTRGRGAAVLSRNFAGKQKNMNIVSAILGTASIVMLCASLVEPKWFLMKGGQCCLSYIGLSRFFGHFYIEDLVAAGVQETCGGAPLDLSLCVNSRSLSIIHVVIGCCFFAILSSLFSFILDVVSPRKRPVWKALKRYAIGYIFSVLNAATTVGFCYWASQEIYTLQFLHKENPGSKVEVMFGSGVHLVTAAGGLAILAVASNLLRQYPTEEEEQAEQLLDEMEDLDDDGLAGFSSELAYEPNPPPPYVP